MYYAIDLGSIFARQYYAPSDDKTDNFAVTGTINWLNGLFKQYGEHDCLIALDSPPYIRSQIFNYYKANRKKDDEYRRQMGVTINVLKVAGFAVAGVQGYEADDVIYSAIEKYGPSLVVTCDTDLLINVEHKQSWVLYIHGKSSIDDRFSNADLVTHGDVVFDMLGVYPDDIPSYKAIAGDAADNIKGAVGVGVKTAACIINMYGIGALCDGVPMTASKRARLINGQLDVIGDSLALTTPMVCDVPAAPSEIPPASSVTTAIGRVFHGD